MFIDVVVKWWRECIDANVAAGYTWPPRGGVHMGGARGGQWTAESRCVKKCDMNQFHTESCFLWVLFLLFSSGRNTREVWATSRPHFLKDWYASYKCQLCRLRKTGLNKWGTKKREKKKRSAKSFPQLTVWQVDCRRSRFKQRPAGHTVTQSVVSSDTERETERITDTLVELSMNGTARWDATHNATVTENDCKKKLMFLEEKMYPFKNKNKYILENSVTKPYTIKF